MLAANRGVGAMVSVGRILEGAFGLIREHFTAVAIWAGVYFAANLALLLTMQPMMQQMLASSSGVPVGPGMTTGNRVDLLGMMLPMYSMNLLIMLVGIVLYTAAMRAVLRPQAGGVGYLRVGGDELRMLALTFLFLIVFMLIGFGFAMLFGLLTAGAAMGSDSLGLTIAFALFGGIAVFVLFMFLLVRFSLAFPLTLHRRRFVIGEAWTLSKGRFWTLFGSALIVTLIGFVLMTIVSVFAAGSYFADIMAASGDPEAAAAAAERQLAAVGTLGPAMILQTLAGAVIGAIWIALSGGSAATAAKLMLEGEFDDAEKVFG